MRIKHAAVKNPGSPLNQEEEDFIVLGNEIVLYEGPPSSEPQNPETEQPPVSDDPSASSHQKEHAAVPCESLPQVEPQEAEPQPMADEPVAAEPKPSSSRPSSTPKSKPTPSVVYVRRSERNKANFKTIGNDPNKPIEIDPPIAEPPSETPAPPSPTAASPSTASSQDKGKRIFSEEENDPSETTQDSNHDLFGDEELLKIFNEKWEWKAVIPGKMFLLKEIKKCGWDLGHFVQKQDWGDYLLMKEPVYDRLVKAFYASASKYNSDGNSLVVDMKGSTMVVTADTIAEALGCENDHPHLYDGWFAAAKISKEEVKKKVFASSSSQPQSSKLNPICRLFHKLCCYSILPRAGTLEKVTDLDLLVIYHLLTGKLFSLPYLILKSMIASANPQRAYASLPYGMLLTRLFQQNNISLEDEVSTDNCSFFGKMNVQRMLIKLQPSQDYSSPSESDEEEERSSVPRTKKKKLLTFSRKRKDIPVDASGEPSTKSLKESSLSPEPAQSPEPQSSDKSSSSTSLSLDPLMDEEAVSQSKTISAEAEKEAESQGVSTASAEGMAIDTLAQLAQGSPYSPHSPQCASPEPIPSPMQTSPPEEAPTEKKPASEEAKQSTPSMGTFGTDMVNQFLASPILDSGIPAAAPILESIPVITSRLSSMDTFMQQLSSEKPPEAPAKESAMPDIAVASTEVPPAASSSRSVERNIQKVKSDMKKLFSNVNTLQNTVNEMIERFTQHQFWVNNFLLPAIAPQVPPMPFTQFQPPQNLLQPSTSSSSDHSSPSK